MGLDTEYGGMRHKMLAVSEFSAAAFGNTYISYVVRTRYMYPLPTLRSLDHRSSHEQVFCPKVGQPGNEDMGYHVTFVEDRRNLTTDMVVFDVEGKGALEKGPVSRIRMPIWIPPGLHGIFVEGLTFDA